MQYLGGKQRVAEKLAEFLQDEVDVRGAYTEPFVGSAAVMCKVRCENRAASDANAALISMWRAVCAGWAPPECVSEDEYNLLRELNCAEDPLTAFAGFGCSFGGKWFGGYARSGDRNYAANARSSISKKARGLVDVVWTASPYATAPYFEGGVVYCDPPYANTTGYGAVGSFDSRTFWDFVRRMEGAGSAVFVSEYVAPEDFECVWETRTKTDMHTKAGKEPRVERLFRLRK